MKVIDMHCDTFMHLFEERQQGVNTINLKANELHIDIAKMKKGDYLLQNFAMFLDLTETDNPYEDCKKMIAIFNEQMELCRDEIGVVRKFSDIEDNLKAGKLNAMLTMEEGAPIKGSIETLQEFYDLGVRMLTLTWNYNNEIGHPNFIQTKADTVNGFDCTQVNTKDGLTKAGIEIVKKMEEIGMIVDVSHGSDALFKDILTHTTKPFVASHSNARAVCNHSRNLPDEFIIALANRGGVMGMNYCQSFISDKKFTYVADIIKHIKHIKNIAGVDCIGLGSDFDGISSRLEMKDASMMPMLCEELKKQQFTEDEIEKIFYKNVLRVYKEAL